MRLSLVNKTLLEQLQEDYNLFPLSNISMKATLFLRYYVIVMNYFLLQVIVISNELLLKSNYPISGGYVRQYDNDS